MKIAINGTYVQKQASGLGIVTTNLIDRLMNCESEIDFTLYSHADYFHTHYPNRIFPVTDGLSCDRGFSGHLKRLLWYQTSLNWQLKRQNTDLFWSPVSEGMLCPSIAQVVTVHDLIPLKYPQVNPKWRYYYLYVLPLILQQCQKIICISKHTKQDLIRTYHLDPKAIEVVYNGYDCNLFYPQPNPDILTKYNLDKYLLYVGDMRFYKNLDRCLQAFDRLPEKDYKFVITGKKDDFFYPQLKQKCDRLSAKERIIFLNYVPTADLPSLYSMAQCLVFVSLYEGFGLPVLEAMACGCPIITCDRTSLPEVGGDSVFYVDPEDIDSIAQGMHQIIINHQLREDLKHKGLERAKLFGWDKSTKALRQILETVLLKN